MKCPFRSEVSYTYVDLGNGNVSLDSTKEDYPDCYETNCPLWKYDIDDAKYTCIKAKILEESDGGLYCEE